MAQPPYIYQDGDPALPPPFLFPGLETRGFPLMAGLEQVGSMVDRFLNIASAEEMGFWFTPLAPLIYLTLNSYPKMISEPQPYQDLGFIQQQELMISIPVVRWEESEDRPKPVELALFNPYLIVDAPWSVVTGRTVLGFPKVQGWFEVQEDVRNPYPFFVETLVFRKYAPDTRQSRELLVAVDSTPGQAPTPGRVGPLGDVDNLFGPNGRFPIEDPAVLELIETSTVEMRIQAVQLQQFRDAAQPETAGYQAITDSRMIVSMGTGDSGPLPPGVIEFRAYDSLDIAGALGMGTGPLTSLFPYWIVGDTVLDQTRNLYRRCST